MSSEGTNPLKKYYRQPKSYIRLPSKGRFYPAGSIDYPENGEIPIYPMTAKDELTMKTPDALINGESTVEVIKSCCPNIKDPWNMPSIDLDAVLIAIRMASQGEKLEVTTNVPVTGEERKYDVDLRELLDGLISVDFESYIQVDKDLSIEVRPINYREFTQNSLKTFEEQRIFQVVNNNNLDDTQKLAIFSQSFKKLTNLTINLVLTSIVAIETPDGRVTSKEVIADFIANADKKYFDIVLKHLEKQKEASSIKPLKVNSTKDDIEKGAPETFEIPITFDQSNFFE